MRIVFMGTPEFSVPCLKILNENYEVCGVYSQPDKPKGRGHKLMAPPVKEYAVENNIPVFQPITLKKQEVQDELKALNPDLIVVVAYGKILPVAVLEMPKYGCINVHASLLPKYRGAGPIQWSVINGETKTGVTTMYMAQGIDTGDMLLKEETLISENETAGELHDRLSEMGAELLLKTVKALEKNELKPQKQDDELSCYAPMLTKELSKLDFNKTAKELHNLIRGLSPWPVAETTLNGKRLKVYKSVVEDENSENENVGIIVGKNKISVACKKGVLRFTEVQLEGSKRMTDEALLCGHKIEIGTVLGK